MAKKAGTPVGAVTKVRGKNVTIQLSNNRKVEMAPNTLNLKVGDRAPKDLVQAFEKNL